MSRPRTVLDARPRKSARALKRLPRSRRRWVDLRCYRLEPYPTLLLYCQLGAGPLEINDQGEVVTEK